MLKPARLAGQRPQLLQCLLLRLLPDEPFQPLSQLQKERTLQTARATDGNLQEPVTLPVSPASMELVLRRSLPIISLSPYINCAIEKAVEEGPGSLRAVRKGSQLLTDKLKQRSRSKARGGTQDLSSLEGSQKLQGTERRKAQSWKVTAREIRRSGSFAVSNQDEEVPGQQWDKKESEAAQAAAVAGIDSLPYDAAETAGYAAARMPACYSVAWRIFDEVELRLPGFKPQSLLDFGAGPGTAIWAALDVWEHIETLHAIEPSAAMKWLGVQIEAQHRLQGLAEEEAEEGDEAENSLKSTITGRVWAQDDQESHQLNRPAAAVEQAESSCEAAYSNSNLAGDQETQLLRPVAEEEEVTRLDRTGEASSRSQQTQVASIRWLQHLKGYRDRKGLASRSKRRTSWIQSTGGKAYDIVIASYSLGELENAAEQRRALRALWQATGDVLVLVEPGTPSGSALVRAARAQILEWSSASDGQKEAHVVAPCPHDGGCPMDGTRSWCHFTQKFERTRLQRHAKIRHKKPLPRSYQDERFAYVVIRRGARPEPTADVVLDQQVGWLNRQASASRAGAQQLQGSPTSNLDSNLDKEAIRQLMKESLQAGEDEDDLSILLESDDWSLADALPSSSDEAEGDVVFHEGDASNLHSRAASMAADVEEVVAASQHWSRIVRPPRKRAGHVVLDLCSATGPEADPGAAGALQRQAIATSNRKTWLSPAGHRIARKLQWGDLWPSAFQKHASSLDNSKIGG